jgi:hypothetical protein
MNMQTLEIEAILDVAYHKAACLAAYEIRRHLRPFNLKRHAFGVSRDGYFTAGGVPVVELDAWQHRNLAPVLRALSEASDFVAGLEEPVRARLDGHL